MQRKFLTSIFGFLLAILDANDRLEGNIRAWYADAKGRQHDRLQPAKVAVRRQVPVAGCVGLGKNKKKKVKVFVKIGKRKVTYSHDAPLAAHAGEALRRPAGLTTVMTL